MAPPVTSGTVAQYPWNQQKVIDHAFRRSGLQAQLESAENIIIAQDCLSGILNEWCNAGFPLWTRQFVLLGCQVGSPDVPTPAGTLDVLHCYWRTLNPWRGGATLSNGSDGSVLFGGAPNADVTIPGPSPAVTVNFGSPTELDTIGVLLGTSASLTTAFEVLTSSDGITFTLAQTLPSATYSTGAWVYFDLNPSLSAQYVRLLAPVAGSLVLNQLNFGLANGQDIEIGVENIDDYWSLPNKAQQGDRAVTAYVDRQLQAPVIKIWNVLNTQGFYGGTVSALTRRVIQDPGAMTNALEVPPRAIEALIWRLASRLIYEIPDKVDSQASYFALTAKQQKFQIIEQNAVKAEGLFWSEERTRAPLKLLPSLRAYTA